MKNLIKKVLEKRFCITTNTGAISKLFVLLKEDKLV